MITAYFLLPALLFTAAFVWYTIRRKSLTPGGAFAAAGMGLWVLSWAGMAWLIPLFFFFITGTLLGRLSKGQSRASDARHGLPRDAWQVWCNGGPYAVLATFTTDPDTARLVFPLMALSMAVSTSDTWSSEIGQYFRQKTVDLVRWQPVPPGLSGGVSLAGTLGGLAGATAMALVCAVLAPGLMSPDGIALVTTGGFAGMLLDSLLGATLQARYRNAASGDLSDQSGAGSLLDSGFRWMSNDGVNFWSNLLATAAGWAYLSLTAPG